MAHRKPWEVSDEFWAKVEPLIPAPPSHAKGGRPRASDRSVFEAMVHVLKAGIQWNALPREIGASSTVHDRFKEWRRKGFFEALHEAGLTEHEELAGIEWEWQSADEAEAGSEGKERTARPKRSYRRRSSSAKADGSRQERQEGEHAGQR